MNYTDIFDLTITEKEAGEAYAVLEKCRDTDYLAMAWTQQIDERWQKGEELTKLMHLVLGAAYRWYEKWLLFGYLSGTTNRMCEELFEALGIEKPEAPTRSIGHGA
jgi:hypothetical protein